MDVIALLFACSGTLMFGVACYIAGRKSGIKSENDRCFHLCHQAILTRMSGTTRWVMNAISSGEGRLMDEERFFGK